MCVLIFLFYSWNEFFTLCIQIIVWIFFLLGSPFLCPPLPFFFPFLFFPPLFPFLDLTVLPTDVCVCIICLICSALHAVSSNREMFCSVPLFKYCASQTELCCWSLKHGCILLGSAGNCFSLSVFCICNKAGQEKFRTQPNPWSKPVYLKRYCFLQKTWSF